MLETTNDGNGKEKKEYSCLLYVVYCWECRQEFLMHIILIT